MSDFGLTFFWQILFQDFENAVNNRYVGDAEFQGFKSFLISWPLIYLSLILVIFVLSLLTYVFFVLSHDLLVSSSFLLLVGLSYVFWRFCGAVSCLKIIEPTQHYCENIERWQFKDYIFTKPISIEKGKTEIKAKVDDEKKGYVLYAIVQFPCGHFGFRGVTNQNIKAEFDSPKVKFFNSQGIEKEHDVKYAEKTTQNVGKSIGVPVYDISHKCVAGRQEPKALVGFRLRGGVEEKENKIEIFSP